MPSSVVDIPRSESIPTRKTSKPSDGEIFCVTESLLQPFHSLCMSALDNASVRTTVASQKIVESICSSSRFSTQTGRPGKERPAIICPAPAGHEDRANEPWLFLMGTFDGQDETTLPKVYKDFSVTVCTSGQHKDNGDFCIRTIPEWETSTPGRIQWVVVIPVTTESGTYPTKRWFRRGRHNLAYYMDPAEMQRLIEYSQDKVEDFFQKLYSDRRYVEKVARELNKHEMQYRAQKKREYAASRKSFTMQRLTQGMKLMQLNNTTNTAFDHASVQRSSPQKTKPAASVYSKTSACVVL
ncbi:hypothetical protein IW262DRAFT_1334135 [Armillaria fumosa]|nr:hypothetical protein IW262DRAFT_1334135 [Armillaria fumosa]